MWRPDNWPELIQNKEGWIDLNSLEVGADTMLEALKTKALSGQFPEGKCTEDGRVYGYMVFISER